MNGVAWQNGDAMSVSAARLMVDTLVTHGVDRIFCVPGESFLPVLDALHDRPEIDLITCRHEGGAGLMAVGDAKLTGRTGRPAVIPDARSWRCSGTAGC